MKKRLLLTLVVGAMIALVFLARSRRRAEWFGIGETEARAKLEARIPRRVPEEKRREVIDKVVAKMRDQGVIAEPPE